MRALVLCALALSCRHAQAPHRPPPVQPTRVTFGDSHADVAVSEHDGLRTYVLTSTAKRRDNLPENPRTIVERAGEPRLRTGNAMFDALHALALDEVREASVASIRTEDFDDGKPLACPAGGCFETGRLWTYVWTRDTSYSADLALAMLDPRRARNSLELKLSERRTGGGLEIVQDTGSGGSWPVSTDRVAWALGAEKLLLALDGAERTQFRDRAFEALKNTLDRDRRVAWDDETGLYRGETSFLDWRAQTYPASTATDTLAIGMSEALSTNVLHVRALSLAADLAAERGDRALTSQYRSWATALQASIRARLWLPDRHLFSMYIPGPLDRTPVARFDLLGEALAVISGVADDRQAAEIVAAYPMAPFGPPVVWPEERGVPVYHNRAVWPFVTAYWMLAARRVHNDAVAEHCVMSLVRGAALELSNVENFEAVTGDTSVPVVDSQRQLWSIAGYLSMVDDTIFGRQVESRGIRFSPYVTAAMHRELFAASDRLVLDGLSWRGGTFAVTLHLPPLPASSFGGAYRIASVRANGKEIGNGLLPDAPHTDVDITLEGAGNAPVTETLATAETLDAPQAPWIRTIESFRGVPLLTIEPGPRSDATDLELFRDGVLAAKGHASTLQTWLETRPDMAQRSACYAVDVIDPATRNTSHRSPPVCWWGEHDEGVTTIAPGAELRVATTGDYLVQLLADNPGDVTTGVTCAVARVTVEGAEAHGSQGYVFVAHGHSESSYIHVKLEAGKRYHVTVDRDVHSVNMSAFAHFAHYTRGRGGRTGENNSMRVDAIRILRRP